MTSQYLAFHRLTEGQWPHSPLRPRGSSFCHCWRWRPRWRSSSRRTRPSYRRWWLSWWRWSTCLRHSHRSCSRRSCPHPQMPTRRCCLCLLGPGGGQKRSCQLSCPWEPGVEGGPAGVGDSPSGGTWLELPQQLNQMTGFGSVWPWKPLSSNEAPRNFSPSKDSVYKVIWTYNLSWE